MDLLNISNAEESSVLTEGEMLFTLNGNTNIAVLLFRATHDLTSWPSG